MSLSIRAGRSDDVARYRSIDLATQRQFEAAGHPEFLSLGVIPGRAAERAVAAGRILVAEVDGQVEGIHGACNVLLDEDGSEVYLKP